MKKLLNGICLVLMFTMLVTSALAVGGQAAVVTPYTDCATVDELRAAFPAIVLADAPQGSTEISYASYVSGAPTSFAQIMFTYEGNEYTYRAMGAATADIADAQEEILAGIYIDFDEDVDEEDVREGEKIPFTVPVEFTFEFELEYNTRDAVANLSWYNPQSQTQYNLYSETAGMPDMKLLAVAQALLTQK